MKKVFLIVFVTFVASLAVASMAKGEVVIGGDEIYGPWMCSSCSVSVPMPDASTRAYINGWKQWQRDNVNFAWRFSPGDKIVVCNGTHCATYIVTITGYLGEEREPISPPPDGDDGNGGGGGGGSSPRGGYGGGFLPPGCIYGCLPEGEVTVRPIEPMDNDK